MREEKVVIMTDNFSQNMIVISSFCLYLQYYLSTY